MKPEGGVLDMLLDFEHIRRNGREYVLVPEENFRKIREEIEDAKDLRLLRSARRENEGKPLMTHAEMMRELGLED